MSRFAKKKSDDGSYVLRQDSLKVTMPHITLEVNCPNGLDLETARQLIDAVTGIELGLTKDVVGGKAFASQYFPSKMGRDTSLPDNVIEFRDEEGRVLGRITNVGRITPSPEDEDED